MRSPPKYAVKRNVGGGKKENRTSVVMIVSWTLILAWLVFLFYCWRSGQLHSAKMPSDYASKLSGMLGRVDQSLRGAKENQMGIPHAHIGEAHEAAVEIKVPAEEPYDLHVIFSTDCTTYQDWQTLVLFHSAMTVGQKGPLTRIASGCDEAKKKTLTELYHKLYPQYHVHFTPDFKKDDKTGHSCKLVHDTIVPTFISSFPCCLVIALLVNTFLFVEPYFVLFSLPYFTTFFSMYPVSVHFTRNHCAHQLLTSYLL